MVIITNFPPPEEGIRHMENETTAFIEDKSLGLGKLYIAESQLSWVCSQPTTEGRQLVIGDGFSLQYPAINLHAISKDKSSFPFECLYLLVDGNLAVEEPQQNGTESRVDEDNDTTDDANDEQASTIIRFAPANVNSLESMFKKMSECQCLHPDPEEQLDDDDDDDNYFDDGEERMNDGDNINENGSGDHNDHNNADREIIQLNNETWNAGGTFFTDASGFDHLNEEGRANLTRMNAMLAAQNNADAGTDASEASMDQDEPPPPTSNGAPPSATNQNDGDTEMSGQFEDA